MCRRINCSWSAVAVYNLLDKKAIVSKRYGSVYNLQKKEDKLVLESGYRGTWRQTIFVFLQFQRQHVAKDDNQASSQTKV